MKQRYSKTIVMALGGSVMVPDEINVEFLKRFRKFILLFLKNNTPRHCRFIIVAGGGKIARDYQRAANEIIRLPSEDKDWIGIHATRINAHLLRTIFREKACPTVLDNPHKPLKTRRPIIIASGWRPGWSTDYIAMILAKRFHSSTVIIAGRPSHVYDKDNGKYKDAKKLTDLTWKEYRKLITRRWSPGLPSPVDPIAAKEAQRAKITAVVIRGDNLQNLKNVLLNKKFEGTTIHS